MISPSQAVEAARRALSLCVTPLSRSPDSVTDDAKSEYYGVAWDSAYTVWVSKQTGVIRRIFTSRRSPEVARRQHASITRIKSEKDFAAWQDLAAQMFQTPRDALPISSEMTSSGYKFCRLPYVKNWPMPLTYFDVNPGLCLSISQTAEGPQIDVSNEWRYDFDPWPSRWIDSIETLLRAKVMLDKTDSWQSRKANERYVTMLSVERVCTCEKLDYIVDGRLKPNYYSQLKLRTFGDEMWKKYPRRLMPASLVVLDNEVFAFHAADGRLVNFSSGDPTT